MSQPKQAPYGSWKSPITSDLLVAKTTGLGQIAVDGEDIYWIELRPTEAGRCLIVRRTSDGRTEDITPAPFNVRTRVHEYGGGDYVVSDGTVFFSNFADQQVYRQDLGRSGGPAEGVSQAPGAGEPRPVTSAEGMRYADFTVDRRGRLICVREDHSKAGPEGRSREPDLEEDECGKVLVSGNDFYSSPRLSLDGSRLAWLTWSHPNMPWDGTELWVGELDENGRVAQKRRVAGGPDESIFQPEWSPDGTLYFISDRTGPLAPMEAEFGLPHWVFGMSTYAFESAGRVFCAYQQDGTWRLALLDTATGKLSAFTTPYTHITGLRAAPGKVVFQAGSPTEPPCLAALDAATGEIEVLRRSCEVPVDAAYLSVPEEITFPTEGGLEAHAFFYRPRNPDYEAPPGQLPPMIVKSHGGPTGATSSVFSLGIQYWTSRGFAVADVNYGGSVGYGRAYRERLRGRWGMVDVDDCCAVVRYLAERGEVDATRAAITGGSAGGYTTLAALAFRDAFKAGASHFGVSDLEALARETHKFESRYLDGLVGPYPEEREKYLERSPIHHADDLSCPVIFFQGLDDKVVPPDQAERMVRALRDKGIPVAYVAFEGEGHGFRRAENIKRSLDGQLYFFSRVFGFELPEEVEPVPIENLG